MVKNFQSKKQKVIVIVGPTASGKSDIALQLAKDFHGFLISADSRQIYKEMNILTAKDIGIWKDFNGEQIYFVDNIPEFMVDIIYANEYFSVADYQKRVFSILDKYPKIFGIPIIVGGTGLYISAVVYNYQFSELEPDFELRKKLQKDFEQKGLEFLLNKLKVLDPVSYDYIDKTNPRRIIRALEFVIKTGKSFVQSQKKNISQKYDFLQIGILCDRQELYRKIEHRIDKMLEKGAWDEVKYILSKYGENLNAITGIGYVQLGKALSGELTEQEAVNLFKKATKNYAKRQLTWFKRDKNIHWVKNYEQAYNLVKDFLA